MLEKIVQIKNVGRFKNYSANGDVAFRKMTLVYAENGRGKTTLCAVLRSLQNGQKEFITERKTLAVLDSEFVHIRINGTDYKFTNSAWLQTHPDVVIFDPVFVNDNVYSGDYVEHDHKKNLYRLIVGAQGVELAKQIEELDSRIREANANLRAKKDMVSKNIPQNITLEEYLQWQPVADIDNQIQQKTDVLTKRQLTISKTGEIQSKGLFQRIQLPTLPTDFITILEKKLEGIVVDAEVKVREQIAKHQMGRQGEAWLYQGLTYVKDDHCPFCQQNIQVNDLISAYRSHFYEAYRNLKEEVAQLGKRVNDVIGELVISNIQQIISNNQTLAEFWKQFIAVELPSLTFMEVQQKFTALRESSLALAKKKQDNPAESVATDSVFDSVLNEIESLQQIVEKYNIAVEEINKHVNQQKTTAQRGIDLTGDKNELVMLQAKKRRFEPDVVQASQTYQEAITAKTALEQQKDSLRQQLDQHCQTILQLYEHSINEFLDQFSAGFRITNTRHLYTGGTPSSHYQIMINDTTVELGDSRTEPGTPCFKTTLSSGDRSALALAFFLAVMKQDGNVSQKIIVFDDPFTSLDRFRRTCTQQLIQRLFEPAKQVIVLSHDPHFLKLLWDGCPSPTTNVKTLQMSKTADTTIIGEWDVIVETQSTYLKNYSTLLNFYRERKGELRSVAMAIRPFLEGMLRSHFPGHFAEGEWLGDFIGKIRAADTTSGLQHAKADLNELDAINGYSKKYHHDQNSNADSEPINDDELYGYVKRTLKLVGGA